MESIYLPIANTEAIPLFLLVIGVIGGVVSSLLGIGSGIIITPSLILIGIPSSTAIVTQLINAAGNNFSGMLMYWREKDVDFSLGFYVFLGGCAGAMLEFWLLAWHDPSNTSKFILKCLGIFLLVVLSIVLFRQAIESIRNSREGKSVGFIMRHWMIYFPFHKVFTRTRTEISIIVPLLVGAFTGVLTSTLGGSISLLVSPILTYLIGRISRVVTGTTLMASFGINVFVAFLYGSQVMPADFVMLTLLFLGGIIGNQIGGRLSYKMPKVVLGILSGSTLLVVCGYFINDLSEIDKQAEAHRLFSKSYGSIINLLEKQDFSIWYINLVEFAHQKPFTYTMVALFIVLISSLISNKLFHKYAPIQNH